MPKSLAIRAIEGQNVPCVVSGKGEPGVGGQHSGERASPDVVGPANLSSLIINGFDQAFGPDGVVCARPAISAISRLGEVHGITVARRNDEQSALGIETGRAIVGHTAFVGSDEAPIGSRFFVWFRDRAADLMYSEAPVHRPKRNGE